MTMWLFYILTGGGTHLSKFRDLCTTIGEFYHVQTIPQKPCQKILNHILKLFRMLQRSYIQNMKQYQVTQKPCRGGKIEETMSKY